VDTTFVVQLYDNKVPHFLIIICKQLQINLIKADVSVDNTMANIKS